MNLRNVLTLLAFHRLLHASPISSSQLISGPQYNVSLALDHPAALPPAVNSDPTTPRPGRDGSTLSSIDEEGSPRDRPFTNGPYVSAYSGPKWQTWDRFLTLLKYDLFPNRRKGAGTNVNRELWINDVTGPYSRNATFKYTYPSLNYIVVVTVTTGPRARQGDVLHCYYTFIRDQARVALEYPETSDSSCGERGPWPRTPMYSVENLGTTVRFDIRTIAKVSPKPTASLVPNLPPRPEVATPSKEPLPPEVQPTSTREPTSWDDSAMEHESSRFSSGPNSFSVPSGPSSFNDPNSFTVPSRPGTSVGHSEAEEPGRPAKLTPRLFRNSDMLPSPFLKASLAWQSPPWPPEQSESPAPSGSGQESRRTPFLDMLCGCFRCGDVKDP